MYLLALIMSSMKMFWTKTEVSLQIFVLLSNLRIPSLEIASLKNTLRKLMYLMKSLKLK